MKRSGPRRGRWLLAIGLAVSLVLGAAFALLRLELDGDGLADEIATMLNKRMRGRIGALRPAWIISRDRASARSLRVPSGSPSEMRLPPV